MRYTGKIYRPPSEARSYILQATIGCSWNNCTYCDMYIDKKFQVRDLKESLEDLETVSDSVGQYTEKMFVADGDALILPMDHWLPILETAKKGFPRLRQVSCYAMARNVLEKSDEELRTLREAGLSMLYIGPESGDPTTLKKIAKGDTYEQHVEAAQKAHQAGMKLSVITLLGAGGVERSQAHAEATAKLITDMDPAYSAALTLTVIPGTPQWKLQESGRFVLPDEIGILRELHTIVSQAKPTASIFRTNHASNYLPIAGILPKDGEEMAQIIDMAIHGEIPLRPEWGRGL